jgi:predicted translin family RNA/ssDNA-binding protein
MFKKRLNNDDKKKNHAFRISEQIVQNSGK